MTLLKKIITIFQIKAYLLAAVIIERDFFNQSVKHFIFSKLKKRAKICTETAAT